MLTPSARNASSRCKVSCGSSIETPSVTSKMTRDGAMPLSAMTAATRSTSLRSRIWIGDRFTATVRFGQRTPSVSARRNTNSPSWGIRPLCSASGMKTEGPMAPRVGWVQRNSASTPIMAPPAAATTG